MDKAKQKLIDKLGKKGFDTEKAIKTHSVYSFLMDGTDPKPEKKEAKHAEHERSSGNGNEGGINY